MATGDQPPTTVTTEQVKTAFKAFKKRLKLTQLDAESRISANPLSNRSGSGIMAIMPPHEFPPAVWDELVKQGKLKKAGRGMYELVTDK